MKLKRIVGKNREVGKFEILNLPIKTRTWKYISILKLFNFSIFPTILSNCSYPAEPSVPSKRLISNFIPKKRKTFEFRRKLDHEISDHELALLMKFWVTYALRGRRYWQNRSKFYFFGIKFEIDHLSRTVFLFCWWVYNLSNVLTRK